MELRNSQVVHHRVSHKQLQMNWIKEYLMKHIYLYKKVRNQ